MGELLRLKPGVAAPAGDRASLLEQAAMLAGVGAFRCELGDGRLTWTDGTFDLFGFVRGDAPDRRDALSCYAEPSRVALERLRAGAIERRGRFALDAEITGLDGRRRWLRISARTVVEHGRAVALYGLKQDVTEERAEIERLRALGERDAVTGLASRAAFQSRFLDAGASPAGCALILIDLDGFKPINDAYGHLAGDACLREVAVRLGQSLPHAQMIARIGGDEFAILCRAGVGDLEPIGRRLLGTIAQPVAWPSGLLQVGASIGMTALPPSNVEDPLRMFARADRALYAAKRAGKGRLWIAEPD